MAKQALPFKARTLDSRRRLHTVPGQAVKISQHRLQADDWRVSKSTAKPQKRCGKKPVSIKTIKRPADLLKSREDSICLHCGTFSSDSSCGGIKCLRAFRKQHLASSAKTIELRGPSAHTGYGTFVKPGKSIAAGARIGEYIGELHPLGTRDTSLYRFDIPGVCTIDASAAGNWCRFINSSCCPNVRCWADFVGGYHIVLFQALRAIGEGEELTFQYGRRYFEKAGYKCRCTAVEGPHVPSSPKSRGKSGVKAAK